MAAHHMRTICALPVLLSIYKRVVGRASREHLSAGVPLWYTTCALPVLLSIYKRKVGRASCEHLSGGDSLWFLASKKKKFIGPKKIPLSKSD